MFDLPLKLTKPGLFVTATDTGVGKTVITCAIARALREQANLRVGVFKPLATDCRRQRAGLVAEDAEALKLYSQTAVGLETITPLRFAPPLAPAVAAQQTHEKMDWPHARHCLEQIEAQHDAVLVEGVGGVLVPIDALEPGRTVLDLIAKLGYPVVVVTRAGLGTLNHTALTVRALRQSGCRVAGLVINGYQPELEEVDPSLKSNRQWLEEMNRLPVLATVPAAPREEVQAHKRRIPQPILDAVAKVHWPGVLASPRV